MSSPTIVEVMTASPHTIGVDQPARDALGYMQSHSIRHIPVLKGGRVVGLVSIRDLQFLFSFRDVDDSTPVEEAMSSEVYCAPPSAPLRDVVTHMAEHKIGSTVITDGNQIVGIFTTTDALRVLAERL